MKIKEVSEKYNITPDTLRYYEKIGLIPSVERDKNGNRIYKEDIGWVEFIKCMRNAGITIERLIEYVNLFMQGDETIEARKDILKEQRKQLLLKKQEIEYTLNKLDKKIENYDICYLNKEKDNI
ncbi:MerR family transcriptional regulator [Terrisporobacter sp.]|uniref:MerR family transcriptional regulator n=1 Tax=Terrisporobacter sp. TaxID=1965305 RepID=UPI002601F3B1|nr:MerR family transcriptional regulator [Terrisporobacter sp.]